MIAAPASSDLPSDCRLVSIIPGGSDGPVTLCAVIQFSRNGSAGAQLVLLNSILGGRVYLGALSDRGGRVQGWLELWVQMVSGLSGSIEAEEAMLTNDALDLRWRQMVLALSVADPGAYWQTGWETGHPLPVWLDTANGRAVHAVGPDDNSTYRLCTDDRMLLAAGLEAYSGSLHRYLFVEGRPDAGFVAATAGASRHGKARAAAEVFGTDPDRIPFNPEGGLMFVRRLAPLELRHYAELLSGRPFQGLTAGRSAVKLRGPFAALDDWDRAQQEGRHLFSHRGGRAGRFIETVHLKLQLFAGVLRAVRTAVAHQRLPLLGLSIDSFRVGFATPAGDLPVLWTAQVALTDSAASVSLPGPTDGVRLFRPVGKIMPSIFRPARQSAMTVGRGELRLRAVRKEGAVARVEGTMTASDLSRCSVSDVIRLRVPTPSGPAVELWGTINTADGLVQGEARFRSSSVGIDDDAFAALARAEGAVLPGTPFDTVPVLSSPCDLYSLGAIGAQLFLASGGEGLAVALDDLHSLARTLDATSALSAGEQVRAVAESDSRWVRALGPQHHGHQPVTAEEAFSYVPLELWWDVVAFLARLFPGAGPMSYRRDLGDAPPQRLEAVFDQPIADLENILGSSRSLLLGDWMANREVARVLQRLR